MKLRYAKKNVRPKRGLKYFLPAFLAIAVLIIGSGIIYAATNIQRTVNVDFYTAEPVTVSPSAAQPIQVPVGGSNIIPYTVTNVSNESWNVSTSTNVLPSGVTVQFVPQSFTLVPQQVQIVEVTISGDASAVDCQVVLNFTPTQ